MKKLSLIALGALALAGCSSGNEPTGPELPENINAQITENLDSLLFQGPDGFTYIPLTDEMRECVPTVNQFSFKLFNALANRYPDGNIIVSPLSVFNILSMIANGDSNGEIRDEILSECAPVTGEQGLRLINDYNAMLLEYFPKLNSKSVCTFANAILHEPQISLCKDFMTTIATKYHATDIPQAPYGNEGRDCINSWVSERTNGMIPEFLREPIGEEVALVNAAYFKAQWCFPFDEEETTDGKFKNADGSIANVRFMNQDMKNKATAVEIDDVIYVDIPYGYSNYSFCILLPPETADGSLPPVSYECFKGVGSPYQGGIILSLPKFSFASDLDVFDVLPDMGLTKTGSMQFYAIANTPLTLNTLLHSSSIEVNEKGAEAGSATMGGLAGSSGLPLPEPVHVIVDRPFYFFIKENSTGTIIYTGAVRNL